MIHKGILLFNKLCQWLLKDDYQFQDIHTPLHTHILYHKKSCITTEMLINKKTIFDL